MFKYSAKFSVFFFFFEILIMKKKLASWLNSRSKNTLKKFQLKFRAEF